MPALPGAYPGDGGGPGVDKGLDVRRYIAAVLRFKWLVVLVTLLGTGAGVVASRFVRPVYVAQATVWVPASGQDPRGPIQQEALFGTYGWIELLKTSFVVLDDVVRDLRLYLKVAPQDSSTFAALGLKERFLPGSYRLATSADGSRFELQTADGGVVERGTVGDSIGAAVGFAWVPAPGQLPASRRTEFTVLPPRDAALRLQQKLEVRIVERGANFMSIRLEGDDPELLARTVNRVADGFVDSARALSSAKHRELIGALAAQLDSAETRLRNTSTALEGFRVQTITEPSDRGSPVPGGIQETRSPVIGNFLEMRAELDGLRHDRDAIERALAESRVAGLAPDALLFIGSVQSSTELSRALANLTERQAELTTLRLRYTDRNPEVRRAAAELRELQERTIPDLARALLAQMAARERELETRIASGARELRQIPRRSTEEQRLTREVEIAAQAYGTLKSRFQDAKFAESAGNLGARVLDRAAVPQTPIRDAALRLIAMALVGSLGAALLVAILLDHFDRRVRYPEQVKSDLGLPILGAVPRVKGAVNGRRLAPADTASVVEALRGVRLGLMHAYGAAGPILVTVSSPGAGEGKSFVVANLALSFAEAGHRTLVIDADVRRGELHRLLGGSRKPGLTDVLQGSATPERATQTTAYSGLAFLGSGTRMSSAPELLASSALNQLLLALRSSYDVVLIDSPPLVAGVDPFVLGTASGSMLLVVRTGMTDKELIEAKLDVLDRLPIRVLGVVLNDIRPTGSYRYYAYSYYTEGYEARSEAEEAVADTAPALGAGRGGQETG